MILDTWQNPATARYTRCYVFAHPTPALPSGATLEEILAITAAYRAARAPQPATKESTHDTPELA